VITDEISLDVEKAIDVAEELGLDYIELRGCWEKNVKDLTDLDIRRIRRKARSAGLEVICIASPFFKCNITDKDDVSEHLAFLPRAAEIAKQLDAEIVRGFAFWSAGNLSQYRNTVIEKLAEAADICRSEGVVLALENEHDTFIGTGKEARAAVEAVDSKNLRLVWDPGNAICAGEVPYPDGYLQARDYMVYMHLKDAVHDKGTGKTRFVAVGSGEIDYEGQFKALNRNGYSGCVSIETHYRIQDDGEKSTRETHAGLRTVLERLSLK